MNLMNKICAVFCSVFFLASIPATGFAGSPVKLRHIVSIYADGKGAGLKHPEGVGYSETGMLIVADTGNGRLLKYGFKNGALEPEVIELEVPQLTYPVRVEINSKGMIYVLDGRQRRIVRLSAEGAFQGFLEPTGLPAPEAYVPRSFKIDADDNIYLLDILSRRVLVLDSGGRYIRHVDFPDDSGFFSDLAIDFKENTLIVDSAGARVFSAAKNNAKFSPVTGSLKQYVRFPTGIVTDRRGRIYLLDRNGGSIGILGQEGAFLGRLSGHGWKERLMNHPSQMCYNGKGEVFVADTSNSRVQIFSASD